MLKGEKRGVWTGTIKEGVNRNLNAVIRECYKGKTGAARFIRTSMLRNLKKIEDNFILESEFDQAKLIKNEWIARKYFSGKKAQGFKKRGYKPPRDHDFTILVEAMILKEKYGEIFLYTYDKHFGWFVNEIKIVTKIDVVFCGLI